MSDTGRADEAVVSTGYCVAVFAVLGPLIGAVPLVLIMTAGAVASGAVLGALVAILLVLMFSYLFGFVPALVAGFLTAIAARRLPSRALRVAAGVAIGAAAASAWLAVSGPGPIGAAAILPLSGALAGGVCTWIATAFDSAPTAPRSAGTGP